MSNQPFPSGAPASGYAPPPPAPAAGAIAIAHADFGKRFAQYLIDVVIIWLVPIILVAAGADVLGWLLGLVAYFAYFTFLEGSPSGQTLGMKALGIRVVDAETGRPIDLGRAALRSLGRYLASILYLGYLWVLFDPKNQGWHDKIARTLVVNAGNVPGPPPPAASAQDRGPLATAAVTEPVATTAPPAPPAPPTESPPANWYPDPQGQARLRYWDGNAWTDHTAA